MCVTLHDILPPGSVSESRQLVLGGGRAMLEAPSRMTKLQGVLLCCLLGAACGEDAGNGGGGDDGPDAGLPADAAVTWSFAAVHGIPNLDDDDGTMNDWAQPPFAGDDDFSPMTLPASTLALVPAGGSVELSLTGDTANVRVFKDGVHVLGAERGTATHTFTPTGGDAELSVEFGTYLAKAELTLTARDSAGATVETTTTTLQASPLIMNNHLQPAEQVWMVTTNGNESMEQEFQTALGAKFTTVADTSVDYDVWIQDEFEFATMVNDQSQRMDVTIDSIRDRGLESYSSTWFKPDSYAQTWGDPNKATSYDSFGNLEASPPVTVEGVSYPYGKIYYGRVGTTGLTATLGTFLTSQKVQAPFQLPTNWLCVGHVDEISTFVPAPGTAKGFKLVIADTKAAYTMLAGMSSTAALTKYGADHGYPTVGDILGDTALKALNDDLQADYLDPITQTFKTQLGLTDDDIIKLPSLFEVVNQCGGRVAALIPGMANLIIANVDGNTTHLFTADPFFRASAATQAADPIINAFKSAMPAGVTMHFVDDWDVYHLGLGEVHCGTNTRRTPSETWWTAASHLMGGN
jgi:protein-arginine deiminase